MEQTLLNICCMCVMCSMSHIVILQLAVIHDSQCDDTIEHRLNCWTVELFCCFVGILFALIFYGTLYEQTIQHLHIIFSYKLNKKMCEIIHRILSYECKSWSIRVLFSFFLFFYLLLCYIPILLSIHWIYMYHT